MDYFVQLDESKKEIKQINVILQELLRRVSEGVPIESLENSMITYSMFNGQKMHLYWISIEPFLEFLTQFSTNYVTNAQNCKPKIEMTTFKKTQKLLIVL